MECGDTNAATYETQKRLAAEAGLNMVGSFLLGGTVTNVGNVVFYETDGKYYGWGGTLPKTVAAGSTPETSGGIGAGAWVDRTDNIFRNEIASITGSSLVGTDGLIQIIGSSVQTALSGLQKSYTGGLNVLTKMTIAEQLDAGQETPLLNHTESIIAANTESKVLIFPAGFTFNLVNWEPLAGTVVLATGATLQRFSDTEFLTTGSSAALVITNDNITIKSGKWRDNPGITKRTFSGAFLVNGGDNFTLYDNFEITDTWGAITGHFANNNSLVSRNFRVIGGWLHHNIHNTYFADIDGLSFLYNVSEYSVRDGMKTYRNVLNTVACFNYCRYNGDGDLAQSQDGMDLFISGTRCIIAMNYLHNNQLKGLDIKRNSDGAGEANQNKEHIIAMNFIYNNINAGIQTEVSDDVGDIPCIDILFNKIFGNGVRGAYIGGLSKSKVIGNSIYNNARDGLRVDNCTDLDVFDNTIFDNKGVGINTVTGSNINVRGNTVIGGGEQINGIIFTEGVSGYCKDNNSHSHTYDYTVYGTNPLVRGKTYSSKLANNSISQVVALSKRGSISQVEVVVNNTATMDITLSKRSATDGTHAGTITTKSAAAITPYLHNTIGLSGSGTNRRLVDNNTLLLTLSNITSSFTDGIVNIHYID